MSRSTNARRLPKSGLPAMSTELCIDKTLLLYRREKSAKPHRENLKKRRESHFYNEAEKTESVNGRNSLFVGQKGGCILSFRVDMMHGWTKISFATCCSWGRDGQSCMPGTITSKAFGRQY